MVVFPIALKVIRRRVPKSPKKAVPGRKSKLPSSVPGRSISVPVQPEGGLTDFPRCLALNFHLSRPYFPSSVPVRTLQVESEFWQLMSLGRSLKK